MPSSVVHFGLALLLVVGLLGTDYDRRALVFVVAALLLPEADTLFGAVLDGAHRTVLHTLVVAAVAVAALWWDTRHRSRSWVRGRFGDYGVRLLWVLLFVHVFAHVLLDYAHLEGVNALWPLRDQFFRLEGEMYYSTAEGFVQTFVDVAPEPEGGGGVDIDTGGGDGREDTHVANPVEPTDEPTPDQPVDRRFPVAVQGWQLYLVVTGLFAAAARSLQSDRPREDP